MFDRVARRLIDPPLNRVGAALALRGWTADRMTLLGLILGLGAALLIAAGLPTLALLPMLAGRAADGLDGAIARNGPSRPLGGYYDIVADFAFYGAVPVAFVALDPAGNGLAGAVLLLSFYVNGASFLGFAVMAEGKQMQTDRNGKKSFFHATGLVEGSETILFFVLICLYPDDFSILAWLFAGLCLTAAALRIRAAGRIFAKDHA